MKLITKLLIIALLALSIFLPRSKNVIQTNSYLTVAIENDTDYDKKTNTNEPRPYSLRTTTIM